MSFVISKIKNFAAIKNAKTKKYAKFFTLCLNNTASKDDSIEYAIIASKKYFKKAVDRNRAKRRIRAAIAEYSKHNTKPQFNQLLFIAKNNILQCKYEEISKDISKSIY